MTYFDFSSFNLAIRAGKPFFLIRDDTEVVDVEDILFLVLIDRYNDL
jgi:hypothetical protein